MLQQDLALADPNLAPLFLLVGREKLAAFFCSCITRIFQIKSIRLMANDLSTTNV